MKYYIGDKEYETLKQYIDSIDYQYLRQSDFEPAGLTLEEESIVDEYADYKHGYRITRYIYTEDHKYSGKKKPLKKDKKYFGVEVTHNNHGDAKYSGFSEYELRSKRVTTKWWQKK